jgi:hypothetical protein
MFGINPEGQLRNPLRVAAGVATDTVKGVVKKVAAKAGKTALTSVGTLAVNKAYAGLPDLETVLDLPNYASAGTSYFKHAIDMQLDGTGEFHAKLKNDKGALVDASYMGPGTDLMGRLQRGDQPVSRADMISQRHDMDYALAATARDPAIIAHLTRRADIRMAKALAVEEKLEGDSMFNINTGRLILAKMKAEDYYYGVGTLFVGEGGKVMSHEDDMLLRRAIKQLEGQSKRRRDLARKRKKK